MCCVVGQMYEWKYICLDKDFLSVIGGRLQCNTCQYLLAMKNTSQD